MLISLDWLKEYVDLPGDAETIADRLTAIGLEVERIVHLGGTFEGVVVGEVQALERHPRANHLWIAKVHAGDGVMHQVVTGADNVAVGDRVPMAPVGARLADGTRLTAKTLRGVPSHGMICSARELALGEDAAGILILDPQALVGADLNDLYPADILLDCAVSPARPDCLSHLGVAGELAAAADRRVTAPATTLDPGLTGGSLGPVGAEIEEPALCRRYIARVIRDVQVGPSPAWLQRRLRAVGLRPVNNVVDVTNFVLMEFGQPLHAFDLDRLEEQRIIVRRARAGEGLRTLDGAERALNPQMLVIADARRAVALAGVIGGSDTAVTDTTRNILLESATFEGPNIRATSRALPLRTEASIRFAKQLSPALALVGAARACHLLQAVAGGIVVAERVDAYPRPHVPPTVSLDGPRLHRLLGTDVHLAEGGSILQRLGFQVRVDADRLDAVPPAVRLDINIPEDLIEEIGRIRGYEHVHAMLPGRRTALRDLFTDQSLEERSREVLVGACFDEAVTYAFTSRQRTPPIGIPGRPQRMLEIVNPLSVDWDALRTSLLPGLMHTAAANARVDVAAVTIFEISRAFWPRAEAGTQPEEPLLLALLDSQAGKDADRARGALRQMKGVIERLRLELARRPVSFEPRVCPGFHPGRCAVLLDGDRILGVLGEIHPELVEAQELPGRAVGAEIDLLAFAAGGTAQPQVVALPRFPAVVRDLAVTVPRQTLSRDLVQVMRNVGGYTLTEIQVLDEYEGPQAGAGRKSLQFRCTFQAPDRTLTNEEVSARVERIARQLEADGAEIRGTI